MLHLIPGTVTRVSVGENSHDKRAQPVRATGGGFGQPRLCTLADSAHALREQDGPDTRITVEENLPMRTAEATYGRQRELAMVSKFLDKVEIDGAALVVSGQAGAGKSHLLRAAAATAVSRGASIHAARGVEHESTIMFAGLNELLLPLRDECVRLGSLHRTALDNALGLGQATTDDIVDLAPVVEAVRSLVGHLTTRGPVLIIIDDLQWLDPASQAVVAALAQSVVGTRAGLLTSVCSDAHMDLDLTSLTTCHLGGLDVPAARNLLEHKFPALDEALLARVLAESQGLPLLLSELPASLDQYRPSSSRLPDVLPINDRLHRVFGPRLAALPTSTRDILLMAALTLDRTTPGPDHPLTLESSEIDVLAPAVDARLVDVNEQSRQIRFSHPLVSTTVAAQSTSAERRATHLALADRVPDSDGRVRHMAHVALEADEELASELEQVGRRLERQGHGVAAGEMLRLAADLSPGKSEQARRLVAAAYLETNSSGDLLKAASLMTEARNLDPGADDSLTAAIVQSRILLNVAGDVDGAHAVLVASVETHAQHSEADQHEVASALYLLADICAYSGRPELSEPLVDELARRGEDAPSLLMALTRLQDSPDSIGPAELSALHSAPNDLAEMADPATAGRTASATLLTDELHSIHHTLRRVARAGQTERPRCSVVTALSALAAESFSAGRWDESALVSGEGQAYSDRHDYPLASREFQLDRALVAAARGSDDVVDSLTPAVENWAVSRGALLLRLKCHRIHTLSALGRGDFEGAYRHALMVRPLHGTPGCRPLALAMTLDLAEAAVRTNRPAVAVEHVRSLQDAHLTTLSPRLALITAAAAGLTAEVGARSHFDAALALEGVERWPFDVARVRLYYGERLRRMRSPAEARVHLQMALGTFMHLGAVRWAVRAQKELDATAMTKGSEDTFGPASLTPQEREVAMLAAAGLTNKEIASQLYISPAPLEPT